jgi:hypothetical protein
MPLPDIPQGGTEHLDRAGQVQRGQSPASLRFENRRRPELHLIGQQVIEPRGVAGLDHRVPCAERSWLFRHACTISLGRGAVDPRHYDEGHLRRLRLIRALVEIVVN